jgi:hypothetical protein
VASGFDPHTVPTTTLAYITGHRLPWDRGLSLDNWGGYIRYETGQRVFVDDRTTFYSRDFYQRYERVLSAWLGWQAVLDQYRIAWVLVPKTAPIAGVLRETAGWRLAAEDRAAYLFVRTGSLARTPAP